VEVTAMGFYDDGFSAPPRRRGVSRVWVPLLSGIAGGLVVFFGLVAAGWGPLQPAPIGDTSPAPSGPSEHRTINVDVNTAIADAVAKVEKAVVGVVTVQEDFWSTQSVDREVGSGFVFERVNGRAHIATNYHVVETAANGEGRLEVVLPNGARVRNVKLLGVDPFMDLAVLEIPDDGIEAVAQFGNSDNLRVGEPAVAIGNPLGLEFARSVTAGIISSIHRTVPRDVNGDKQVDWELDVIQTDAAINQGNSGGPLINISGQVIGINSAKISAPGVEGLGFSIPINDAEPVLHDLVRYGKPQRAYLGVQIRDVASVPSQYWHDDPLHLPSDVDYGVIIVGLTPMGPAARAGLQQYDVIVKLDDQKIENAAQLRKYLYKHKRPGDTVRVTVYRGGLEKTVEVKLMSDPQS